MGVDFGHVSKDGYLYKCQHHHPVGDDNPDVQLDDDPHDEYNAYFHFIQHGERDDNGYGGLVAAPISDLGLCVDLLLND